MADPEALETAAAIANAAVEKLVHPPARRGACGTRHD